MNTTSDDATLARRLTQFLESIHPAQSSERVHQRADDALVAFHIRSNRVDDALQYRKIFCDFVALLDDKLQLVPRQVERPRGELWRRAVDLLRKTLGPHGELAAFDMIRSGSEGLYAVLRRLALTAARQQVEAEIAQRVESFCGRLTADEYLKVGEEYLRRHGHLLPPEMTEGFAGRARLNLVGLLRGHHQALVTLNAVRPS